MAHQHPSRVPSTYTVVHPSLTQSFSESPLKQLASPTGAPFVLFTLSLSPSNISFANVPTSHYVPLTPSCATPSSPSATSMTSLLPPTPPPKSPRNSRHSVRSLSYSPPVVPLKVDNTSRLHSDAIPSPTLHDTGSTLSSIPSAATSATKVSEGSPHTLKRWCSKLRLASRRIGLLSPRSSEETLVGNAAPGSSTLRAKTKLWAKATRAESKERALLKKEYAPQVVVGNPGADEGSDAESEGDDDLSPPRGYVPPPTFQPLPFSTRHGSRQHRYPAWEVPYPISYDKVMVDADERSHELLRALAPGSDGLSFHRFARPPTSVLDLGCGEGFWIADAAAAWKDTRFVGLDLMENRCILRREIRDRVRWVRSNFLEYRLPFSDASFDFVRMSFISLGVPKQKWRYLLSEVRRVLAPGGVVEWIDDDIVFPRPSNSQSRRQREALEEAASLQAEFRSLLGSRELNSRFETVSKLLKGRGFRFELTQQRKIRLGLPGPNTRFMRAVDNALGNGPVNTVGPADRDSVSSSEVYPASLQSRGSYMPPGLVVQPGGRFLPLNRADVEALSTHGSQLLLGAAEGLWVRRNAHGSQADRDEFDDAIWEYERKRLRRLNFPDRTWESLGDKQLLSGRTVHQRSTTDCPRRSPMKLSPLVAVAGEDPVVVRSLSVLVARSG